MVRCPGLNTASSCSIGGLKPAANAVCSVFCQQTSAKGGYTSLIPIGRGSSLGKDMSPGQGQSMRKDQAKPLKKVRVMLALTR